MTRLIKGWMLMLVVLILMLMAWSVKAQAPSQMGMEGMAAISAGVVAPPIAKQETQTVENPYGIGALWSQGDSVARGTLLILLIMSAATWYVTIVKFIEQTKLLKLGQSLVGKSDKPMVERIAALPESPYLDLLDSGKMAVVQVRQSSRLDPDSWIATAVDDAVDRVNGFLQSGMSVLATVGSTSPFVGLFGTVWGIYHALTAIGVSGQASIDKVAGPVGEALIMTAIGLAVAVPAVLCYNWLLRRNRRIMDLIRFHGDNLHAELVMTAVK